MKPSTTDEFDLIRNYIATATQQREDVSLGIGDDCALLTIPADQQLAVSMDTLVVGRHFIPTVEPTSLGHKALAVNLSDLAAMGATPAWATLSLTLPGADAHWQTWLKHFMAGFRALADQHQVQLVGGDTTRGPLSITVQVHGFVAPGQALRRDAAQVGDNIYVSGTLGDAGLALLNQKSRYTLTKTAQQQVAERLNRPTPRIELGQALIKYAHAAIDISDGLGSELRHLCQASGVGAQIQAEQLPLSLAVQHYIHQTGDWQLPISAGDDYEILFTVPQHQKIAVQQAALSTPIHCIGQIIAEANIQIQMPDGRTQPVQNGYNHFRHD